jgi:hypothetical protein
VEGLKLGGALGDAVCCVQFLEETVSQVDSVCWFGYREGLPYGVGYVPGKNLRGVFVFYVLEHRLQFCCFVTQSLAK